MSSVRPLHKRSVNMQIHPGSNIAWDPLALAKDCKEFPTSLSVFQVEGIRRKR